jgi:hypothetical protein
MPSKNPEVRARNSRAYYERSGGLVREKTKVRNAALRARNRAWINEYISGKCCAECSENHPGVLDFHHIDPETKYKEVALLLRNAALDTIQAEIAKCIILCANCHRKFHWNQRQ